MPSLRGRALSCRTALAAVLLFLVAVAMGFCQSPAPTPVIVDDDGSADGMIGLLCLLQDPQFQVKAVTICQGLAHPDVFAPLAARMLARVGRGGIPVAAGRLTPVEGTNAFPDAWRGDTDRFWGVDLPSTAPEPSRLPAARLIVETIRRSPQPVIIVATGPLTNVAEALRLSPSIARKIRLVEVMGGAVWTEGNVGREWPAIDNQVAEWNIWVDPMAAQEVLASGVPARFMPLDVTNKVVFYPDDATAWRATGTPEGELAADLLDYLHRQISPTGCSVWDALAAVDIGDPRACWARDVHIEIVTEPGPRQGMTALRADLAPNCQSCRRPRAERIKARILELLAR
ncbi:MAG: nucleoside hydrolase [Armatimonadetes bacterium]|nr:nucleoside hydrolase [Armatimonadota bacterium]